MFNQKTRDFIIVCRPTRLEITDLEKNHNFGGLSWMQTSFSDRAKNEPHVTPRNTFESDVTNTTPRDNSQ